MREQWIPVKEFEHAYEVSTLGRVRSLDRYVKGRITPFKALRKGRVLIPHPSRRGYLRVILVDQYGKNKNISVHRLVAIAFVEGRSEVKNQVNHIDGDKSNNTPSNLEWCTIGHNNRHAREMGLNVAKCGPDNHSYGLKNKQSLVLTHRVTGELKSITEVAKELGFTTRHVTMMVKGERNNKTDYILIGYVRDFRKT